MALTEMGTALLDLMDRTYDDHQREQRAREVLAARAAADLIVKQIRAEVKPGQSITLMSFETRVPNDYEKLVVCNLEELLGLSLAEFPIRQGLYADNGGVPYEKRVEFQELRQALHLAQGRI